MTSSTVSDPTRSMLRPRSYATNPTQNPPRSISSSAAKASRPEPETTRAGRVATRNAFPSRAIAPQERLIAAEFQHSAAVAGYYPSLAVAGDYGEIGAVPGDVLPTYHLIGTLNIPIFEGGRVHADTLKAEAALRQAQAELADVRGRIDQDVRNALLDLKSASDQVEVAQSTVNLAEQTLAQAQDRFAAGVTDNLEVVQAQESVASAHEDLITSLYQHNLAKVSFARAIGRAEEGVREYLRGKP